MLPVHETEVIPLGIDGCQPFVARGRKRGGQGIKLVVLAGVSLRRGRLRRLPAQDLVRASAPREGSSGHDPLAGGSAAGGEGIPAKRGVRTVSQATSGRRTQAGAADATRRSLGTLLRSDEGSLPTPYGRDRRQSHARGDEDRPHARSQPPQTVISTHVYALFVFRHTFTTPGFSATLLEPPSDSSSEFFASLRRLCR
jgi:hypothetical protein